MPFFFAASANGTSFLIGEAGICSPRLLIDNMRAKIGLVLTFISIANKKAPENSGGSMNGNGLFIVQHYLKW